MWLAKKELDTTFVNTGRIDVDKIATTASLVYCDSRAFQERRDRPLSPLRLIQISYSVPNEETSVATGRPIIVAIGV